MDKIALGQKLREARIEKGFTQHALAEKAAVCNVYLGEIERGLKMPSMNIFIKIIEALDVSADYILREELPAGRACIRNEITQRLQSLTPQQHKTAISILDAYIKNLD